MPTSVTVGAISRTTAKRLASSATASIVAPVMLPPGLPRLATMPSSTGSAPM